MTTTQLTRSIGTYASVHILRTLDRWFDRLVDGSKTADLRKHDRDFQIGDRLIFVREDDQSWMSGPTGERTVLEATVTHVLPASVLPDALQPSHVMLSLSNVGQLRKVAAGARLLLAHCPTCMGRSRETVDMVCPTCGRDYGAPSAAVTS
jgi:hypothetical protein